MNKGLTLLLTVTLLALLQFNIALNFHFLYDDWGNLWYVWSGNTKGYADQFDFHPGNYLTFIPAAYLFGTNPIAYNFLGLVSKIGAAFVVGFFAATLLKQKKAFYLTAILYAAYFGSMESYTFTTARNNVLNLVALLLAFTFFMRSFFNTNKKEFIASLSFIVLSFFADPIRMIFVPFIFIGWEGLTRWYNKVLKSKEFIYRAVGVLAACLIGLMTTKLGRSLFIQSDIAERQSTLLSGTLVQNYQSPFLGLGSLIVSVVDFKFIDLMHQISQFTFQLGFVFLIFLIVTPVIAIIRKSKSGPVFFVISLLILFFLIPNWFAFPYIIPNAWHRYQIISSAAFIVLLTFFLLKINTRIRMLITGFLIFAFLYQSLSLAVVWDGIRNYSKSQAYYDIQYKQLKNKPNPELFLITGNHKMSGEQLLWAGGGTIPYSFKKGITKVSEMPSFTPEFETASKLLCNDLKRRPVVGDWITQEKPLNLDRAYAWYVGDNGRMEDISDEFRIIIAGESTCYPKIVGPGYQAMGLESVVSVDQLSEPNMVGYFFKWSLTDGNIESEKKYTTSEGNDITPLKINFQFPNKEKNKIELLKIEKRESAKGIFVTSNVCQEKDCSETRFRVI